MSVYECLQIKNVCVVCLRFIWCGLMPFFILDQLITFNSALTLLLFLTRGVCASRRDAC